MNQRGLAYLFFFTKKNDDSREILTKKTLEPLVKIWNLEINQTRQQQITETKKGQPFQKKILSEKYLNGGFHQKSKNTWCSD